MPQYLLLMYRPTEGGPGPETMADEHKAWQAFTQDLQDSGALLGNKGLAGIESATTLRVRDGETQVTDGPFAETKEYLAGYFLVEAADLDAALAHAAAMPNAAYGSVEVRPVWG
jgi:hypothetical protein